MGKAMSITEQLQLMKQPIIPQCIAGEKRCSKVDMDTPFTAAPVEGGEHLMHYCKSYAFPIAKWKNGNCNMADHLEIEKKDAKKVNPLKASKRAGKK